MKNRIATRSLAASSLTFSILTGAILSLLATRAVHAAGATWTGAGSANWIPASGGTNWSTGADAFPGSTSLLDSTDVAVFSGTTPNLSVAVNSTSLNIGGVDFSGAAGSSYLIGATAGNPLLLSGGPTGTPVLLAGAGSAFAITNRVTNVPAATFLHQTIAAPVIIQNSGATGAGSTTLLSNSTAVGSGTSRGGTNGSALKLTGTVSGNASAGNVSTLYLSGNADFRNAVQLNSNEVSGVIQDQAGGSLNTGRMAVTYTTPDAAGSASTIWYLSGANTYTGGTTLTRANALATSGALRVTNNSALGTGAVTWLNSTQASGSFLQAGVNNLDLSNSVTSGAAGTFAQIGSNNFTFTLSGVFSNSGANTLGVVKSGAGTLNLTNGSSSYSLLTQVTGGTLAVAKLSNGGVNSSIGTAADVAGGSTTAAGLVLNNGTTLSYTGGGDSTDRLFTINGTAAAHAATLSANGTGAVNFTNTGNIAYGTADQTRTLNLTGTHTGDNSLSATIANNGTGAVTVAKSQAGKWVLNGTNTYTGATTITAGTLALGAAGSINNTSGVSIGSAGTFDVSAKSGYTVGTLTGSGNVIGALTVSTTLALGSSPGTMTFGGDLTLGGSAISNFEITNPSFTTGSYDLAQGGTGTQTVTFGGGTLNLLFSGGTYADNSTVRIFNFENYSGTFGTVNVSGLNLDQTATFDSLTGFVTITAVPEPGAMLLGGIGLLALLRRRRSDPA